MITDCVYRYMSLEEFLDIILNKRLTLKYPGNWPDKLEMFFLKNCKDEKLCDELIDVYKKKHTDYSEYDVKSDLQIIMTQLLKVRCQCWTYNKDDLQMWQSRNSNESVSISVKKETFEKMSISYSDIEYKPVISLKELIESFHEAGRCLSQLVLEKKECFSYENEFRLYKLPDNIDFSSCKCNEKSLSEFLVLNFLCLKNKFGEADEYIDFDTDCIDEILVHPSATDEFIKNIKKISEKYLGSNENIEKSKILD